MSKELTTTGGALPEQMEFAKALAVGDMLPIEYRGKPGNVLIAMGLGSAMGLSPAESLYRIAVIKGKPTASAELVAANVRKAGHKLRITTGDDWAEATILRADDPDFPFVVRRDMAWAKGMGLASNDNYRKQGVTMLQWRAITACARLACPDALYGVAYTPDEMAEFPDAPPVVSVAHVIAERAVEEPDSESSAQADTNAAPPVTASVTDDVANATPSVTARQGAALKHHISRLSLDKATYLGHATFAAGRTIGATGDLTESEAGELLDVLAGLPDPTSGLAAAKAALKDAAQGELDTDA